MGMFDTIYGDIKCPHCNKVNKFESQTKGYIRLLEMYTIGDFIEDNNVTTAGYLDYWKCSNCNNNFNVNIVFVKGQIIKFINDTELQQINIEKLDNIEEGLGHRLEYEELCKQGLGHAKERVDLNEHPKKIGDRIKVLNQEWLITDIYAENLVSKETDKAYSLCKFWFNEGYVYMVTNKLGNRVIRVGKERLLGGNSGYNVYFDKGDYREYDCENPHNFIIQYGCEFNKIS